VLSKFDYTYDAVGNITTWSQQQDTNPANSFTLTYDAADQLLSAISLTASFVYTYDAAGNRLSAVTPAGTTVARYNSLNQLESVSGGANSPGTYQWDAEQRLQNIRNGSYETENDYDGLGRIVETFDRDDDEMLLIISHFLWDGLELCEERDESGAVTKRYYPQGVIDNGTPLFYSMDHLGSIRELTDSTGAIRARYAYEPFGSRTKLAGDLDADFGFTGFHHHNMSGLDFAVYRAYDPVAGRWISRDPIGEKAGLNLYAYVNNSPVLLLDEYGLAPKYSKYPSQTSAARAASEAKKRAASKTQVSYEDGLAALEKASIDKLNKRKCSPDSFPTKAEIEDARRRHASLMLQREVEIELSRELSEFRAKIQDIKLNAPVDGFPILVPK